MSDRPTVAYVFSRQLAALGDIGTHPRGRSSRVHALIDACGLLGQDGDAGAKAQVISSVKAKRDDLLRYHDAGYVARLMGDNALDDSSDEGSDATEDDDQEHCRPRKRPKRRSPETVEEKYGLVDDCAPFPSLGNYVLEIAGSSLTAARYLKARKSDIVINLEGGRHHAMRSRASGFCFVQDVALAIQALTKAESGRPRSRVLYLDVDIHHGDGVEAAFRHPYPYRDEDEPSKSTLLKPPPPHVLTLSMHHRAPGFFPSTGDLTPADTTHPFSLNIPLRPGASDATYGRLLESCVEPIRAAFDPDYAVLLLGMDALAGDDLTKGAGNWSTEGIQTLIKRLKGWKKPMLVLGGGGYTVTRSAIGWATATAELIGTRLPEEVPEHTFWKEYGPDFEMKASSSAVRDDNDEDHLSKVEASFAKLSARISRIMAN